jgi:prophage regulatory protein
METKLNDINLYRITQLVKKLVISKSTIWLWVKEGSFPKPIRLGKKSVAWLASDIENWIQERVDLNK